MKILAITFCFGIALVSRAEDPTWKAEVRDLPNQLRGYGLPDHLVEVTFPKGGFPVAEVHQLSHYKLSPSLHPETIVVLKAAKGKGGVGGTGEVATHFQQVELVPETPIDPTASFTLEVVFGSVSSGVLEVAPLKSSADEKQSDSEIQRIIDLATKTARTRLAATLDVRNALDGQKTPAFDYQVRFDLVPAWKLDQDGDGGTLQKAELTSEGTLKLDSTDTNLNDHLELSGNYSFMRLKLLPDPLSSDGTLAYFYGARLKAFEFEADQTFRVVNYTVKPQLAAWIPYSNLPGLWWTRRVGISGNAATPAFVFLGYTHVETMEEDPSAVDTDKQRSDRLEWEVAYAFPVTSQLRVGFRGRWFWLLEGEQTAHYEEVFGQYYLNEAKTFSVILKYSHGEVPPKFEKGSATSAGVSVSF